MAKKRTKKQVKKSPVKETQAKKTPATSKSEVQDESIAGRLKRWWNKHVAYTKMPVGKP